MLAHINMAEGLKSSQVTSLVRGIEAGLQHESAHIYRVDVVPGGGGLTHDSDDPDRSLKVTPSQQISSR